MWTAQFPHPEIEQAFDFLVLSPQPEGRGVEHLVLISASGTGYAGSFHGVRERK